jgi:hypothetical protein
VRFDSRRDGVPGDGAAAAARGGGCSLDPPPTGVDLLLGLVAAFEQREVLLSGLHVVGGGAAALAEAVGRGAAMEVCGAVMVAGPGCGGGQRRAEAP